MSQLEFRLAVTPPQPLTIYGLVLGGHFPLTLLAGHTILLDRNILSHLKNAEQSERSDAEANRYWLEPLNDSTVKINLGLCSLEGPYGRALTFEEFCDDHDAACSVLRPLLPKAQILSYAAEIRRGVYEVQVERHARYEAECAFLIEMAPVVTQRHADAHLRKIERQVLESAHRWQLAGCSLAVIAVLACLYEAKDGNTPSIARRVLKPKETYDSAKAHNAISDLRSLEMLASGSVLGLGPVALCTADRGLAAFWCALKVKNPTWIDRSFSFDFSLSEELFSRLPETEVARLLLDLKQRRA